MSQDHVTYIVNKIKESFPNVDVRPGSATYDLLVAPLSKILEPFEEEQSKLLAAFSMKHPSNISEDDMDLLAANFLVGRSAGSKATGHVRIYFLSPVSVTVPKGTVFSTSDGLEYTSDFDYSISKQSMLLNNERYPLYATGDIKVTAEAEGPTYSISSNKITGTKFTTYNPALVTNVAAFSTGAEKETNAQLKTKIQEQFYNQSLASPKGAGGTLKKHHKGIQDVKVIGAGAPEMIRDIVYILSGLSITPAENVDFYGAVSGLHTSPYNPSTAKWGAFEYNPSGIGAPATLPTPAQFTKEFTNPEYRNIWKNDKSATTHRRYHVILDEPFSTVINEGDWRKSEATIGINKAPPELISIVDGSLRIGLGSGSARVPSGAVPVSVDFLNGISELLNSLDSIDKSANIIT